MTNHRLSYALAALLIATATASLAAEPLVPAPKDARLVLEAVGQGVQIYACENGAEGYHWAFKAPDAGLFDKTGRQIGTHFAGPTWQLADGSKITGQAVAQAPAPQPHAVAWLLLRVKSHDGNGMLSKVDLVRRVDTEGGAPPTATCDATQAQAEARMRYTARYLFYTAPQ